MKEVLMRCGIWLAAALLIGVTAAAQEARGGEGFLGTWSGTWDGAGTGGFELTLEKDKEGVLTCRVSVTGEPAYKATCKTVTFDAKKMTAKYDFPPDERAEVILEATFEEKTAKGTWALREKGTGNEAAAGGWAVSRK